MKRGELLSKVLVLCVNAHAGQFDRGSNPYILHPLKVMHYLKSDNEKLMCVALLHDVIEDTKTTYKDLRDIGCDEFIIDAVRALTKQPGQTYEEYKECIFANTMAMKVKKADLRHNSDIRRLKGVSDKDIERVAKYNRFYMEIEQRQYA